MALALRQTWLNEVDQPACQQLLGQLLLHQPVQTLPAETEQRILDRLQVRLVTPSLGQLLHQQTQGLTEQQQTSQTGFSPETVSDLVNDALHPTTVPLMRMKRLVEFLKLSTAQAFTALQKTADQYHERHTGVVLSYAAVGRLAHADRSGTGSTTGGHFLFESDEALQLYLDRLGEALTTDPIIY